MAKKIERKTKCFEKFILFQKLLECFFLAFIKAILKKTPLNSHSSFISQQTNFFLSLGRDTNLLYEAPFIL